VDEELGLLSASALLGLLDRGEVSSVELLQHHLDRVARLNPALNAVVTLDTDRAMGTASRVDDDRVAGEPMGPLAGLPMTVKDALATEGLRTTGGATELADHVPVSDAEVVAKVRDAGAVVFAKTNLPRWSGDVQATNEIFGTTNNPWDLSRGPGGSSGGASAAVAAGLTPLEIGTDIGGSVRLPAHFAGVCGHKPSFGIVPQRGYVDHVSYGVSDADINVVGPLARTVDDLTLLFDVLTGPRAELVDGWSLELPKARGTAAELRVAAWLDDPACPVSTEVSQVLEVMARTIEEDGLRVDRTARPEHPFEDVREVGLPLISAATSPARTDEEFEELRGVLADPVSADAVLRMRAGGTAMAHRDWSLLAERREKNRQSWGRFFRDHDVLLAPVSFAPAFEHQHGGNLYTRSLVVDGVERPYADLIVWTSQFGYVYLPATVVPVGWTDAGLPVGVQVVGPFLGDRTTLEFAGYLERLLGGYRVPPLARS